MHLDLNAKEYLALLKASYLADWVANAHAETPADEDWEIVGICRKIYALAEAQGFDNLVSYSRERDDYVPTREFVEEMDARFLLDHIDHVFWRELALRLADRLLDEAFGAEVSGWSDEEYRRRRDTYERKVEKELRENGLKNLFLLGDFGPE